MKQEKVKKLVITLTRNDAIELLKDDYFDNKTQKMFLRYLKEFTE